jgi:hypothetical protein
MNVRRQSAFIQTHRPPSFWAESVSHGGGVQEKVPKAIRAAFRVQSSAKERRFFILAASYSRAKFISLVEGCYSLI